MGIQPGVQARGGAADRQWGQAPGAGVSRAATGGDGAAALAPGVRGAGEAAFTPKEVAAAQPAAEQRIAELERFCGQLALENAAGAGPADLRSKGSIEA